MLFLPTFPISLSLTVLREWSTGVSIGKLDIACCNKSDREYLTQILAFSLMSRDNRRLIKYFVRNNSTSDNDLVEPGPGLLQQNPEIYINDPSNKYYENTLKGLPEIGCIYIDADNECHKLANKQLQQRVLLLRHSSKCPAQNGKCQITPRCWSMRILWTHIIRCNQQVCATPHCVSSRYALMHFFRCKDPICPVCVPVRQRVRQNYEIHQAKKRKAEDAADALSNLASVPVL